MEGRFNGGFFSLEGLYLEGLIHGGACFRNFAVFIQKCYTHFHLTDSEAAIVRSLMKQAEVSILSCLVDCFEIIQVNAGW